MSNPKLKDIKVRQAMAHSLDKNLIIETLLYGLGQPIESMVHPSKNYYNKNLKSFDYNIEMANKILDEAGWIDKDGDGVREKIINGRSEALKLEFKYNSGNETRKNIGLIFKENLKKIGIEVNMVSKEFTIFIDDLKKHDFEVYCGGWVGDPNVEDPTQLWHTESAKGGSNYVNYGDMESDRLIDQIAKELNPEVRNQLYMKFQEKVHNEIPYIFIYAPNERMAFSKRFTNTKAYTARPGFDLNAWKLSK
jgi:peptide/nickel transport system substrate-binding protein